jgi:hypothetical protein
VLLRAPRIHRLLFQRRHLPFPLTRRPDPARPSPPHLSPPGLQHCAPPCALRTLPGRSLPRSSTTGAVRVRSSRRTCPSRRRAHRRAEMWPYRPATSSPVASLTARWATPVSTRGPHKSARRTRLAALRSADLSSPGAAQPGVQVRPPSTRSSSLHLCSAGAPRLATKTSLRKTSVREVERLVQVVTHSRATCCTLRKPRSHSRPLRDLHFHRERTLQEPQHKHRLLIGNDEFSALNFRYNKFYSFRGTSRLGIFELKFINCTLF